jgi:hypothetical protein
MSMSDSTQAKQAEHWQNFIRRKHPVWNRWRKMIHRCHNLKSGELSYQERGIEVCQRWRDSFEAFIEDMGEPPTLKHTIERIENSKGYEPGNCRWATFKEQASNRRGSRLYTIGDITLTGPGWAAKLGIDEGRLDGRLKRGWPIDLAISLPEHARCPKERREKRGRSPVYRNFTRCDQG